MQFIDGAEHVQICYFLSYFQAKNHPETYYGKHNLLFNFQYVFFALIDSQGNLSIIVQNSHTKKG